MTTQATTQAPTQEQLQIMYNNFVKISQWLTKKEDAPSPLPPLYADILKELKALREKVEDLEFKQAANLEEIHYLQSLIERKEQVALPSVQAQPEPSPSTPSVSNGNAVAEPEPKKPSRKKKKVEVVEQSQTEEELPSAPSLIPAPAPLKEQEVSANELDEQSERIETEPLDIELDSTVFTSVSEEVSRLLDEINKKEDEENAD